MKKGLKKLPYAVLTTTMVSSIFGGTAFGALDGLYVPRDGQVEYYSSQFLTAAVVDQEKFDAIQDAILNTDASFDEIFFVWADLGYSHSLQGLINDDAEIDVDAELPETVMDMLTGDEIDPTPGSDVLADVVADINDDNSVTISGVAEGAAEVEVTLVDEEGNESSETVEVDEEGNFEFTSEADLAAGDWTYKVVAFDEEGNELDSEEGEFTIDEVAELPVVESVSAVAGTDMKVTVTGKAENADKVTVSVDGGAEAEATLSEDGSFTYTTDALAAGDHTVSVKAYKGEEASEAKTATVKVEAPALKVESVSAINLKQVKVVFNQEVDKTSAETATNYAGLSVDSSAGVVLQSDKKSVIVNLTAPGLTPYVDKTVTISNVKSVDGKVLAASNFTIKPVDTTIPTVTSVVAKGQKTLEITLSEPVQNGGTAGNYKIDGKVLGGAEMPGTATASADGTKVSIALTAALTPGDHKVTVFTDGTSDLADYAGYTVPTKEVTVSVGEDLTVPLVTSVVANSQTKVTVTFNEAMNISTTGDLGKFYWNTTGSATDTAKTPDSIKKIDDTTYELTFTTNPLSSGDVYFFVKDVVDYNNNKIAGDVAANTVKKTITVKADSAPVVTKIEATAEDTIVLTFDSALDSTAASTAGNYEVKKSDGSVVSLATTGAATYNSTNKTVTLKLASKAAGGTYTVTAKGLKSVTGVAMADFSGQVTITDKTAISSITIQALAASSDKVIVRFPEAMATSGDFSIGSKSKYQISVDNGATYNDLATSDVLTVVDDRTVEILFGSDKFAAGANVKVKVSLVADKAGNINSNTVESPAFIAAASTGVDISTGNEKLEIVSPTELKLTLDNSVVELASVAANDFEITKDNSTWFTPVSAVLSAASGVTEKRVITFTVPESYKFDSGVTLANVKVRTKGTVSGSKDVFGNTLAANITTNAIATNKIATELKSAVIQDNDQLVIEFTAPMAAGQEDEIGNALIITQGTKTFTGYEDTVTGTSNKSTMDVDPVSGSSVKYTITLGGQIDPAQAVTVKTKGQDFIIAQDANNNYLKANTTGITADGFAVVSTTLTQGDADAVIEQNDTFKVMFNRNIDLSSVKTGWDGTVGTGTVDMTFDSATGKITIPGVGVISGLTIVSTDTQVSGTLAWNAATFEITGTFTDASIPSNTVSGTSYTFTPASTIKSAGGATIVSGNDSKTAPSAPYLKSAVFTDADNDGIVEAGDTITLTFSEALENSTGEVVGAGDVNAIIAAFDFSNDNFATTLNAAALGTVTITSPNNTSDSATIVLTVGTKGTADLTTSTKVRSKAITNVSASTPSEVAINNAVNLKK